MAKQRHGTASPGPSGVGSKNMRTQAFLTAAAVNLKRLAAARLEALLLLAGLTGSAIGKPFSPMMRMSKIRPAAG
ncbi:MAG: hypothetical protein BroJett024_37530 [Alphaproteobacteria bacterium]|nr:MAG: hypothetical protein BroJett024_37530 [Alphaproteobacteria bacterium]